MADARILYLDVDDEITSAAARVRAVEAGRVALVVPPGSRVATSRINFRLLARDATLHGRQLAIVAPDAAARALAAAAGLEVFASVAEYEAGPGGGPAATTTASSVAPTDTAPSGGRSGAGASGRGAAIAGATAAGAVAGAAGAGASDAGASDAAASAGGHAGAVPSGAAGAARPTTRLAPPVPPTPTADIPPTAPDELRARSAGAGVSSVGGVGRRGIGGRAILVAVALAAVGALIVGGVAAYLLLPAATIVVTPRQATVGPVQVTVTADPTATAVDVQSGVVPAEQPTFDVQASGTYKATGQRVSETTATGSVTFRNCDFFVSHRIDAGSRVATTSGVQFVTDEALIVPAAAFDPLTGKVTCATRDVGITAVKTGTAGNVGAGEITVVPNDVDPRAIYVTNPDPTTGGTHQTFPKVTQKDVDGALADLDKQLQTAFTEAMAAPGAVRPELTLFPETGQLGASTPSVDPSTLVGQEVDSFDLSATATGTALAVDERPVGQVAEAQLQDSVDPGYVLVEGSVTSTVGEPTVAGDTVTFPASATAKEIRELDAAELETMVLGLSPEEATTVLQPYGTAHVELWPAWATTIPSYAFRVELTVEGGATGSPSPSATPRPTHTPGASPGPSASPRPSASPSPSS